MLPLLVGIGIIAVMFIVSSLLPLRSCRNCIHYVGTKYVPRGYKEYDVEVHDDCLLYGCKLKDYKPCKFWFG
jgi:hypothetical protein